MHDAEYSRIMGHENRHFADHGFAGFVELMARLRAPDGCPWDRKQTAESLKPYVIEEAYEVVGAIEQGDQREICEELGDLLLQVVFHAQMAREQGAFDFDDVVQAICDKLVRRHPHVFGGEPVESAAAQTEVWERLKAQEKATKGAVGLLDDVPLSLPALTRAAKLGRRASRAGFDWPDANGPRRKLDEELAELDEALAGARDQAAVEAEFGDLLFALVNYARHLGVDPEAALRRSNQKFVRRFRHVEQRLGATGQSGPEVGLEQLDAWWEEAKEQETSG